MSRPSISETQLPSVAKPLESVTGVPDEETAADGVAEAEAEEAAAEEATDEAAVPLDERSELKSDES